MDFINFLPILILFPFLVAAVLVFTKNNTARKVIVYTCCTVLIAASVIFSANVLIGNQPLKFLESTHIIDKIMLAGEFFLMGLIIVLGIKYKKYFAILLSVVQTLFVAWVELTYPLHESLNHIFVDKLSVIMCLIIGIVGCLIIVYAIGYMTRYHEHHTEYKDRRCFFFPMLFVFIGAMFGLVLSSNLIWIYFFWEITSVSSFLLIGYTKTDEAITNSFRALWMNLLGGLGFAFAIGISVINLHIYNLQDLIASNEPIILLPVIFLAFAALTKSAQMPFSKWLLGAMVAPTPTSALLHSATMVKAGVYMLIRLAPSMSGQISGLMVAFIGGFTFLMTSMLAISQSDGKKVLAYSTISNLGLITACAGIGTPEAVWAGILLMMFHAVSKSMLFQAVGAIENSTGSRDIEDMHALIIKLPGLASVMILGISGMFLAPFGMLISKWAVLKSFIDCHYLIGIILVFFICFGSATTLFYWSKWLCKILTYDTNAEKMKDYTINGQWVSFIVHGIGVVLLCVALPFISSSLLVPLVLKMYNVNSFDILSSSDIIAMAIMIIFILIIPFAAKLELKSIKKKKALGYISGINLGDNKSFTDSFDHVEKTHFSAWYLTDYFGEAKLFNPTVLVSTVAIILALVVSVFMGGVL